MTFKRFVSENAQLDRAYLHGEVDQVLRSQAEAVFKELDDAIANGISPSGDAELEGEVQKPVDVNATGP